MGKLEVQLRMFLNSVPVGGEWCSKKEPPLSYGNEVGQSHGEEKNPCLCWESNVGSPAHSLVTIFTELSIRGFEKLTALHI
jgi:hypothetical protein